MVKIEATDAGFTAAIEYGDQVVKLSVNDESECERLSELILHSMKREDGAIE